VNIRGIAPALVATYDDGGAVSLDRQADLIDHVLAQGVDGVFVSGSTGEAFFQAVDERKAVISAAVEQVAGRGFVIAHTGALDTRSTIALTEYASAVGVDAISAITPVYYEYDEEGYARFYREVAAACDKPLIAYHIPGRAHAPLSADFFVRLAEEGTLQGLKYTSTDLYPLAEVLRRMPEDFTVYNGNDEVLLGGLALGAHGGIGSTYNTIGTTYVRLLANVRAGRLEAAVRDQWAANAFIREMSRYDFLVFLREVLRLQGVATGHGRAPLPTVTDEQRELIRATVGEGSLSGIVPSAAIHAAGRPTPSNERAATRS
jgi:N-acetylneuraminate lyase